MSLFLALLALAAPSPAPASSATPAPKGRSLTIQLGAPVGGEAWVTGHLLNCRTKPDLDAEILTTIPRGTAVTVRRQEGDWQLLKLKTRSCWGSTRYLSTTKVAADDEE